MEIGEMSINDMADIDPADFTGGGEGDKGNAALGRCEKGVYAGEGREGGQAVLLDLPVAPYSAPSLEPPGGVPVAISGSSGITLEAPVARNGTGAAPLPTVDEAAATRAGKSSGVWEPIPIQAPGRGPAARLQGEVSTAIGTGTATPPLPVSYTHQKLTTKLLV
jgi:hypothetical protein